jgi:nitroreductase
VREVDVLSAIRARRSIRKYRREKIPGDVLEDLLDSARAAPSSGNKQRWSMVVVTDDELREKLVSVSGGQEFVGGCSAYLIGVTDPGAHYSAVDLAIALDHLSLRAVELGLGTCWVGNFEPEKIREVLGIPGDRDVPVCMTLGYPESTPAAKNRKTVSELFHKNKWGMLWK